MVGVAMLLAVLGIYGVTSYYVTQRTHEIGIRMALGADKTSVLGLMLGEGAKLAAIGVLLGLLLSFALAKAMAGFLFEVQALDPLTFFAKQATERGLLDAAQVEERDRAAEAAVDEAIAFAEQSPHPEPEDALTDVYVAYR